MAKLWRRSVTVPYGDICIITCGSYVTSHCCSDGGMYRWQFAQHKKGGDLNVGDMLRSTYATNIATLAFSCCCSVAVFCSYSRYPECALYQRRGNLNVRRYSLQGGCGLGIPFWNFHAHRRHVRQSRKIMKTATTEEPPVWLWKLLNLSYFRRFMMATSMNTRFTFKDVPVIYERRLHS